MHDGGRRCRRSRARACLFGVFFSCSGGFFLAPAVFPSEHRRKRFLQRLARCYRGDTTTQPALHINMGSHGPCATFVLLGTRSVVPRKALLHFIFLCCFTQNRRKKSKKRNDKQARDPALDGRLAATADVQMVVRATLLAQTGCHMRQPVPFVFP
jgi:hypothetical protein